MPEEQKKKSKITVIGVGGGGSNAVDYMYNQGITDVEFILLNTDSQALNSKSTPLKIMIGTGAGAGADPKVAESYAEESKEKIQNALKSKDTQMVFITACMGGGTGTGAGPVVARIAREMGILAVGIVTMPLKAEGPDRLRRATEGLARMKENLDAVLIIDNTMVLKIFGDLTWEEAFHKADDILSIGAQSLAQVLVKSDYHVNVDHNDVRKTMVNTGFFLMGCATAESDSETVVEDLVSRTLTSPLLMQNDISGAKNILFSITNGKNGIKASKLHEVYDKIQQMADGGAEIISALGSDDTLADNEVKLIILAAGFDSDKRFTGYDPKATTSKISIPVPHIPQESDDISTFAGNMTKEELDRLQIFENYPAYQRQNRDVYHHVDLSSRKVEKLIL